MTVKPKSPIGMLIVRCKGDMNIGEAATKMGTSRAYLSEIISGKKNPEIHTCNRIADGLGIPRAQVYRAMGWLDLGNDKESEFFNQLRELWQNDPDLETLLKTYLQFDTPEQRHIAVNMIKALLNK